MEKPLLDIVQAVATELRASKSDVETWIGWLEKNYYRTVHSVRTETNEKIFDDIAIPRKAMSRIQDLCKKRFSEGPIDGDIQEAASLLLQNNEIRSSIAELDGKLPDFVPSALTLDPDAAGKFKVVVQEQAFVHNMKGASSSESVFSLATIGDHASGKSFLTRKVMQLMCLLSAKGDMSKAILPSVYPQVQGAENFGIPTTAGLNLFYAPFKLKRFPLSMVEFQDFEGENGGAMPVEAVKKRVRELIAPSEDQSLTSRREAVKRLFPPLAFAFSDVLLVVGSDNFGNSRFKDRISTLLTSFMDALSSVRKPHIIFVWNRCPLDQLQESGIWTERFLKAHDPEGIFRSLFRDFHCVSLPDAKVHPEEFKDRFAELGSFLIEIFQKQALENRLSHRARLDLMRRVAIDVNNGKCVPLEEMMDRMLSLQTGTAALSHFMEQFELWFPQGSLNAKLFDNARLATLHAFARANALRYATLATDVEIEIDEDLLHELWEGMSMLQPCQACVQVRVSSEDATKRSKTDSSPALKWLQCGRTRKSHEEHGDHQSSERVAIHEQFQVEQRFLFFFKRTRLISRFRDRQFYRWTEPNVEFQESSEYIPRFSTFEEAEEFVMCEIKSLVESSRKLWNDRANRGKEIKDAQLIHPVQRSAIELWTNLKMINNMNWSVPSGPGVYCLVCLCTEGKHSILNAKEEPEGSEQNGSPICLRCRDALKINARRIN